ncbi:MAG: MOSC domain-containing protein [Campylobacterota bacterium]|nr:MOSC domain-containing protein [Campylobacterota bacterium]
MAKSSGSVLELFLSIKDVGKESRSKLLVDEQGILEDKFYAKGSDRSILITSLDSYLIAKESGIDMKYGSLGENILVDVNPYHLNAGDIITMGEVELEITQNCTICNSLAKVDVKLPDILKSDRGIFAKALKSGKIRKGDIVNISKY